MAARLRRAQDRQGTGTRHLGPSQIQFPPRQESIVAVEAAGVGIRSRGMRVRWGSRRFGVAAEYEAGDDPVTHGDPPRGWCPTGELLAAPVATRVGGSAVLSDVVG
ncbi:hypothetical protein ALI22I_13435 [Saccharothrix sp. ALI-22-I]|nr:hypothetical protein ALI22I_13435 [Saccharothrix sp. ALI-22-I]